ncbi:MAG: GNAT family N-acetyltransferase [Candidatus Aenigmarchaeota archaeon]|nr:GNAT family N-acetyltransferase [Candidatus Aenigmarchaeota archaeon]
MSMKFSEGKAVGKFRLKDGREVIARLPRKGDEKKLLEYINSLIGEKVYILESKKKTPKEEKEYLKKLLDGMKKGNRIDIILECGGKIISVIGTEKSESGKKDSHVCSIALGIVKEYRGLGIGNKLMEMLIDMSKNKMKCRITRLSVYEPNKVAISLYRKHKFREVGRIPNGINHYGKFIDEIIMVKEL